MKELSSVMNHLPVYTRTGKFVGHVENVILDLEARRVEALLLTRTNPKLVEGGFDLAIPYRWVADYDDILVLRNFPDFVAAPTPAAEAQDEGTTEFIEVSA